MNNVRMKFKKTGNIKFISHLDLIRLIERAFRRAEIPLSFTQGYNPHPKISFATALALGISSEGEYMDIAIEELIDLSILKYNVNRQLPNGIEIIQCRYIDSRSPSLMSMIDYGEYIVKCQLQQDIESSRITSAIESFLNFEEIWDVKIVKKRGQKREKQINIRNYIKNFELIKKDELQFFLKLIIATGSKQNLKPEVAVEKFCVLFNIPIFMDKIRIHRLALYIERDQQLLNPMKVDS